jgi:hypothetical protein
VFRLGDNLVDKDDKRGEAVTRGKTKRKAEERWTSAEDEGSRTRQGPRQRDETILDYNSRMDFTEVMKFVGEKFSDRQESKKKRSAEN